MRLTFITQFLNTLQEDTYLVYWIKEQITPLYILETSSGYGTKVDTVTLRGGEATAWFCTSVWWVHEESEMSKRFQSEEMDYLKQWSNCRSFQQIEKKSD